MQFPTIIFDHVTKTTKVIPGSTQGNAELARVASQQKNQVTTAGGSPKR